MGYYEDLEKNRDKAPRKGVTKEVIQKLKDGYNVYYEYMKFGMFKSLFYLYLVNVTESRFLMKWRNKIQTFYPSFLEGSDRFRCVSDFRLPVFCLLSDTTRRRMRCRR